jgi:putative heme iron utilization protein
MFGGINTIKSTEALSTHKLLAIEPYGTTEADASKYVVTTEVISAIKREALDTNCFEGRIVFS